MPRRVELDLPGQLEQEIVGYPVPANSPYLRRGLLPSWARPTLVVRDEKILSPAEAESGAAGRLRLPAGAAGKGAGARPLLRRHAAAGTTDPALLGDFFVSGDAHARRAGADLRAVRLRRRKPPCRWPIFSPRDSSSRSRATSLPLGPIALVAHRVADGRVTSVGLRLADEVETRSAGVAGGAAASGRCARAARDGSDDPLSKWAAQDRDRSGLRYR